MGEISILHPKHRIAAAHALTLAPFSHKMRPHPPQQLTQAAPRLGIIPVSNP